MVLGWEEEEGKVRQHTLGSKEWSPDTCVDNTHTEHRDISFWEPAGRERSLER